MKSLRLILLVICCVVSSCGKRSLNQQFQDCFSDIPSASISAKIVERVDGPRGLKGAFFSTTVIMDVSQLAALASLLKISTSEFLKIGISPDVVLGSRINPEYPWILRSTVTDLGSGLYRISIEGRQPD